ncbi:MBL fold metallo-hydrolase [Synergistaceae bacterium OttesenSCG-928-I11]|nr:MBL fold metallo-hydrolase [Synergistaceae bacterium OttesenSCG-928-I11]
MVFDYGNEIYAVDAEFGREGFAAVYVLKSDDGAAIIDTAHRGSLPIVLRALPGFGVSSEDIKLVCLTHVHLDHAGGAGVYMERFENARLVVHERGARHMIDPTKLLEGARAVYGAEETARMYGALVPVSPERILTPADGERLRLGERTIVCLDTPGHARHHLAYFVEDARVAFTGDVFGMNYGELASCDRQGIVPSTSPVQFDPVEMHRSIDRIMALLPARIFPAHFGEVRNPALAAEDMHRMIDWHGRVAVDADGEIDAVREQLVKHFEDECRIQRWPFRSDKVRALLAPVIEMNAQGLVVWHGKQGKG